MPEPLDTLHPITTPEGVPFDLKPAGPFSRSLAFSVDVLIQSFLFLFIALIAEYLAVFGAWILFLLFFLLQWFYFVFFETFFHGQTPGKMAAGLQVILRNGTPVDFNAALLRNLLRAADVFFFSFALGLIVVVVTKRFQRLGDLAAGTLVVHKPRTPKMNAPLQLPAESEPQRPPYPLKPEEAKAILSYVQRFEQISKERREELARTILDALGVPLPTEKSASIVVFSFASWLAGQRPTSAASEVR